MDNIGNELESFVIVHGYVDAKNESDDNVRGSFLAVASRRHIKYISVVFGLGAESQSEHWKELLASHLRAKESSDRNIRDTQYERELERFLRDGAELNLIARNLNTKPAEQAVSRYCSDALKLKAVCFINFVAAASEDLEAFNMPGGESSKPEAEKKGSELLETNAAGDGAEMDYDGLPEESKDIFIKCDPILDPVFGVAMNELRTDDLVYAQLRPDSVFYKLISGTNPSFDGTITATVTNMLVNEYGTSIISLTLAEGVVGVMKLSGKVKIRAAAPLKPSGKRTKGKFAQTNIPPELVLGGAALLLIASAGLLIYYLLSL
ncbi:hypothetical protein FACS1894216_22180 [Synergistales bacterium]|nr:hypothetical protein FACS1894216_22180 [Synergistales bacterium]